MFACVPPVFQKKLLLLKAEVQEGLSMWWTGGVIELLRYCFVLENILLRLI